MRISYNHSSGFSLSEMLLALMLASLLMVSISRFIPELTMVQKQWYQRLRLQQEVQHLMLILEKAIRRAGFCFGDLCSGKALAIEHQGRCLIARWDDNFDGRWQNAPGANSEVFAYRWHAGQLQTQRGASDCFSGTWRSVTQTENIYLDQLTFHPLSQLIKINLRATAGQQTLTRLYYVERNN